MNRDRFVRQGRERWQAMERLLRDGESSDPAHWTRLSGDYRVLVADLARARSLDLPSDVTGYLDDLAARAHHALYSVRERGGLNLWRVLTEEAPREVRAQATFFWAAFALFFVPFFLIGGGAYASDEVAELVLAPEQLEAVREMYTSSIARPEVGDDVQMTGFYIYNNASIALRCFATGAFGGLGSVFFLVYNGAVIGTVFGHLFSQGLGPNLIEFTAGHSAWELIGIVVSGAAGLRLGWAMLDTGGLTVSASLRAAGPSLYRMVVAATFMIAVAAAIEGLWSASPLPAGLKLGFGLFQVGIVAAWLMLGGRESGS